MDKTKEYILMCEKAKEIQKLWKPQSGDFYDSRGNTEIKGAKVLKNLTSFRQYHYEKPTRSIYQHQWLPTQSQLQEMVWEIDVFFMMGKLRGFFSFNESYSVQFRTMEQLWLAFVMKEKYKKTWNGKEWVNA